MKIKSILVFLLLFTSCNSSKESLSCDKKTYESITKTKEVAELTVEQEQVLAATIIANINQYTESCDEQSKKKPLLNQIVFIEVSGKNPSIKLLQLLNKKFDSAKKFFAAKEGLLVYNSGLLVGYKKIN